MDISFPSKVQLSKGASYRGVLVLTVIYMMCSALIIFIILASQALDIPYEHFTADPAAIYNAHPFLGLASNVGILLWCAAAAISFFTYSVSKIYSVSKKDKSARFFLYSALITTVLLLDDFFMFHEAIFPWYLGISEEATYGIYFILIIAYLLRFYQEILNSEYFYLIAAFLFLGLSVGLDFILPQYGFYYLVEDGFKLFGIASWFFYYANTSYNRLTR